MKTIRSAALAMALIAVGCDRPLTQTEEFRRGVPTTDAVALTFPGSGNGAQKTHGSASKAEGQRAFFYAVTRGTTVLLNGGTAWVLGLIKAIVEHPPTSIDGNVAVWGPHTEALSPTTYKLTVTRTSPNHYSYALEGKAKADDDSAYVTLISGAHVPALDGAGRPLENYGEGTFLLDFDAARALPEHGDERGTVATAYSRLGPAAPTQIDMTLSAVHDTGSQPASATYRYDATPGQGGAFTFVANGDVDSDPSLTATETLAVRSRWLESGAGRSDARASGGDLDAEATASECWDTSFNSAFFAFNALPLWGVEAEDCAFTSAEFSP